MLYTFHFRRKVAYRAHRPNTEKNLKCSAPALVLLSFPLFPSFCLALFINSRSTLGWGARIQAQRWHNLVLTLDIFSPNKEDPAPWARHFGHNVIRPSEHCLYSSWIVWLNIVQFLGVIQLCSSCCNNRCHISCHQLADWGVGLPLSCPRQTLVLH